jgi:site-specific DNA recombinase
MQRARRGGNRAERREGGSAGTRWVVYCRISDKSQHVENQEGEIVRFLENNPSIKIIEGGWYRDGVEKSTCGELPMEKRPAGKRLLADAKAGHFDMVLVYSIGRLARSTLAGGMFVKSIKEKYGIGFKSIKEPVDTSDPYGWFMFLQFLNMFELERNIILERTEVGRNRILEEKRWPAGKPPYGYCCQSGDRIGKGVIEVYEPEARIVRRIFAWAAKGWTCRRIARQLAAEGVPLPRGWMAKQGESAWYHGAVSRIIRRTCYVGTFHWGKTFAVREEGELIGREKVTDPLDVTELPFPAIVSREEWNLANQNLTTNQGDMNSGPAERSYLLRGLLTCGIETCGKLYHGRRRKVNRRGDRDSYYVCASRFEDGESCGNAGHAADKVEEAVKSAVLAFLDDPGVALARFAETLKAEQETEPPVEEEGEGARARLAELEAEEANVRRGHRKGFYTDDQAESELRDIESQKRLVKARIAELSTMVRVDPGKQVQQTAELLAELREELEGADEETWREVLKLVVERIVVTPVYPEGEPWPVMQATAHLRLSTIRSTGPVTNSLL